jgi:hypothetical protein
MERRSEEAEKVVRDIRRAARREYSAEVKARILIASLRGENSIGRAMPQKGINQNLYTGAPDGGTCTSGQEVTAEQLNSLLQEGE